MWNWYRRENNADEPYMYQRSDIIIPRGPTGQKSHTPTAEIKQKSESKIRNHFANLCARPYTATKPPRTSVFLCGLQILKSLTPDQRVSDSRDILRSYVLRVHVYTIVALTASREHWGAFHRARAHVLTLLPVYSRARML